MRQRVIAHLGDTASLAVAIQECEATLEMARRSLTENLAKADQIRSQWEASGSKAPDDMKTIRRLARHNWDMKFLRNALTFAQQSQKRIPLLERHLASLYAAESKRAEKRAM